MSDYAAAAEDEAARVIRFRRIFVPADRIKDWPVGDGKYLPVDAAEFERLAAAAQSRGAGAASVPAAAITSARYEAKLVGDHLAGQAALGVVLAGPAPAMLPLEPCNLALGKMALGCGAASAREKTAGQSGRSRRSERAGCPVVPECRRRSRRRRQAGRDGGSQRPITLRLVVGRPSLSGRRSGFRVGDAPVTRQRVVARTAQNLTPAIDRGLLVGSEPAGAAARRWHIELGGRRRLRLRILPAGMASHRPQLALLRESRTYDFSLRGVEVSAQWRIQVHNEPLQQVTVLLDPGLQLISARFGDASIPWSVAQPANGEGARVVLTLPEPIRDAERVLRLNALGQAIVGQPWRLPRMRAEGLFWQEGSISLLMSEPLVADRLAPRGCVQTAAGPLSAPAPASRCNSRPSNRMLRSSCWLARRTPTLQVLSATAVELGGEEVTARMAADFRAGGAARFALEADVTRPWIVDAVESAPPGAVADWTFEPQAGRTQRLAIRLSQGAVAGQAAAVGDYGAAALLAACCKSWAVDHLAPLRFRGVTDDKRLVAVRPAEPYALKLSGAERIERLAADNLSPTELELFAEPPKDLLFECDARDRRVAGVADRPGGEVSGTIHIDAAVGEGVLRETCRAALPAAIGPALIGCSCSSFRAARRLPVGPSAATSCSARKWSDREQTKAGWDASLETWELTLRHPKSTPFEITAVREVPAAEAAPVRAGGEPFVLTLASLPEATQPDGSTWPCECRPAGNSHRQPATETDPARPAAGGPRKPCKAPFATIRPGRLPKGRPPRSASGRWRSRTPGRPGRGTVIWNRGIKQTARSGTRRLWICKTPARQRLALTLPPGVARGDVRSVSIDGDPRRLAMDGNRRGRPADGGPAGGPEVSPRGDRMDGFGATAGNRRFVGPAAAGARCARAGALLDGLVAARLRERWFAGSGAVADRLGAELEPSAVRPVRTRRRGEAF